MEDAEGKQKSKKIVPKAGFKSKQISSETEMEARIMQKVDKKHQGMNSWASLNIQAKDDQKMVENKGSIHQVQTP